MANVNTAGRDIAHAKLNVLRIAFRDAVRSMPADDIIAILAKELKDEAIGYTGQQGAKLKMLARRLEGK